MVNIQDATSAQIGILINNTTDSRQTVRALFPNAKKENNYDNEYGVLLYNAFNMAGNKYSPTYEDLLSTLRGRSVVVGATQVFVRSGNNSGASCPIEVKTENIIESESYSKHVVFLLNPFQNQTSTILGDDAFKLNNKDGFSGLILSVPANTNLAIYFFIMQVDGIMYTKPEFLQLQNSITTQRLPSTASPSHPDLCRQTFKTPSIIPAIVDMIRSDDKLENQDAEQKQKRSHKGKAKIEVANEEAPKLEIIEKKKAVKVDKRANKKTAVRKK